MKILLRLMLMSMMSFMYADEDCSLVTDQATCEADDHCVWDDVDGLCEDAAGDHDDHDHGDEEHANTFELTALAAGTATFSIEIMHDGHADYTSMPILVSVTEQVQVCTPGDVNNDSIINVVDIVAIVDAVLTEWPEDICAYDYNGDSIVNVVDIVAMVQLILGERTVGYSDATEAKLVLTNDTISINSDGFVQGVQIELTHDINFTIDLVDSYISDFRTYGNSTTIIVVSDGSRTLSDIATFDGSCKVESVVVCSSEGEVQSDVSVELVSAFEVKVVGPNPFNPSTSLNLVVDKSGYVSVKVYNLVGQQVAVLANGYMEANDAGYTFNWNASQLSSGMYIVKAESAGNVSTQKLMLVK